MRLPPPPHIYRKCFQAPAPSILPASPSSSMGASNLSGREAPQSHQSHSRGQSHPPPKLSCPVRPDVSCHFFEPLSFVTGGKRGIVFLRDKEYSD